MRLTLKLLVMSAVFAASALAAGYAQGTPTELTPAKKWEGKVVVMANGELLGRVEDLAVDFENKTIRYVVVSIGSFLNDDLIAVDPGALRVSEDGFYLVLHSYDLDQARRFGQGNWPAQADVLPAEYLHHNEPEAGELRNSNRRTSQAEQKRPGMVRGSAESPQAASTADAASSGGNSIATISDGQRRATIRPGDKSATIEADPAYRAPEVRRVQQKNWRGDAPLLANGEFERLDENGDGYLSRQEIGSRLNREKDFTDFDYDGNEGIDVFEFQVMTQR